jgi:myo-inositol 2-dehydrogenase / D-chiro-inositol 1-dehydrogenase
MHTIHFGLVGYGAWGSHHARVIAACSGARLAAIVDCDESRRSDALATHPQTAILADFRDLLDRPDIDVVSVALPSHLHRNVGCAALDAGKHVLMEKPMALHVADCQDLLTRARSRGLHLGVAHQFRFSALWGKVKELIDAGAIGDPHYALIELWRNPYRTGADGWRYDLHRVGDWVLEEPIHFFDLARWYFAAWGEPESVYGRANSIDPRRADLQDNFSAILNFPGGRYAVISQTLAAFEHHQVAKLTGSHGALWAAWSGAMDRTFHPTFFLKHFDGQNIHDVPIAGKPGEVYELADVVDDLVAAIRTNSPPRVTGEDGLKAVAMCLKAQESVAKQGPVTL